MAAACFRARLVGEPSAAGERTARVLAGYRRTAAARGRGDHAVRPSRLHRLAYRTQREARVALAAMQVLFSRPAIGVRFTWARAARCKRRREARQPPRGPVGRLDRGVAAEA